MASNIKHDHLESHNYKRATSRLVSWSSITTTSSGKGCSAWMDETQVWSHTDCARANWPRVDRLKVKGQSCGDDWSRVHRCVQRQIRWQMRKSRYEGYLHNGSSGNCGWGRVFWTTDPEKCKTADLVWESKRRFGLVVRLIANKCHKDTFYFLSFLPTVFMLPFLALHTCLISLHRIICGIIWLACSYLELPTSAKSFVTLRTRPKVLTLETR